MSQSDFEIPYASLRAYTVHYRNCENKRFENCFYASDAYEARLMAMEFNRYIHDHPNSIDCIRLETASPV